MLLTRFAAGTFTVALLLTGVGSASGQNYPIKPLRIVTAGAGGGNDFSARLVALGLGDSLGQSVIVENRDGAGGAIAADTVAKAHPDGYSLLLYGSNFYTLPMLRKLPYDVIKDFSPITAVGSTPNVLVVNSASTMMSVKDLIATAKAKPDSLNCTAGGVGGSNHLAAELFKSMAGVKFLVINYKSAGLALTALIGNQAQLMFSTASAAAPHVKAGRLRALGVTTAQPSLLAPGMPTVAASGLPGYEAVSVYGFFAPAKTPAAIVNRLNQETVRYLNKSDVKEKLVGQGIEVIAGTPQQLTGIMKAEITRLGKVIKETGMRDPD